MNAPSFATALTTLVVLLSATPAAHSDDTPPNPNAAYRLEAIWNNDGSILRPSRDSDRHYTNGLALFFTYQPDWAQAAADTLAALEPAVFAEATPRSAAGFLLGHRIYTPVTIETRAPLFDERPYAGYLYGGAFLQYDNLTPTGPANGVATLTHLEVNLGLIGNSALAEPIQVGIHDQFDSPDPLGWSNQLEDEPTFQFYARRKWRLDLIDHEPNANPHAWNAQLIPEFGLALGTVDLYADLALTARYGLHLPDDFGPPTLFNPRSATALDQPQTNGWSVYAFARATGRIVVHNIFIEGNVFDDSPFGTEEEPLFAFFEGGLVASYQHNNCTFEAGYSQTILTDQFENQSTTDGFGQLFIALTWLY
ncbi:MAG: lipid A deacylase LpxR family protein [Planctomycetota bacterium]